MRHQRGFTLIELMVVLVIAGIVVSLVALSGSAGGSRSLHFETERLAQLLALAREESQVRGAPIRLEIDALRYRFLVRINREWRLIPDPELRPREWSAPTQVLVDRPDRAPFVEFGRDAVDYPFSIHLAREDSRSAILANGLGAFVVE